MLIDGKRKKGKSSSRRKDNGNSFTAFCTILLMTTAIATLSFLSFHLQIAITPDVFQKFPVTHSNKYTPMEGTKLADNHLTLTSTSCTMQFIDKCPINPIVKYWDEVMDCYVSPLRYLNGSTFSFMQDVVNIDVY